LPILATLDTSKAPLRNDPGYPQYSPNNYDQNYTQGPIMEQRPYQQPAFVDTTQMNPAYNEGYAHREGLVAASAGPSSMHRDKIGFLKSKWPAAFMIVTGLQAVICLCFEAYVFAQFQSALLPDIKQPEVQSQAKTIPTFLTLFIFGFLYELVVVWDALRMKNTIQAIGVCIANLAMLVYTAIQVDQIREALQVLEFNNALEQGETVATIWDEVRPYLVAIPAIIALATIAMGFISWKLYQEFAWDILKTIGADYRMRQRFLHYQIYIALLKFDFFFFLGFIIQFVVIVTDTDDPEFGLTIATIPITIIILLGAAFFTRRENKPGMVAVIVLYLGGLSYFIFKLVRIYQPGYKESYEAVKKSLTAFAVITILLIILTIVNTIICLRNFGNGLKTHLLASSRKVDEKPDLNSINLQDVKTQVPSRMTID